MDSYSRSFFLPAAGEHMLGSESFSNWLSSHLELAGNEGMEKRMQTTIVGHIGTTIRIHSFIPS